MSQKPEFQNLPDAKKIPIVIVELKPDGSRPFAGQLADRMFYSGSLLKVAAMIAAYSLREAVNDLASTVNLLSLSDFFELARTKFDKTIANEVPLINASGISNTFRVPQYEKIFQVPVDPAGPLVDFTEDFRDTLREMIVRSSNQHSGKCIQALGYSWINGVMQDMGLFRPARKEGIWLCGDYLRPDVNPDDQLGLTARPTVNVPTLNDGLAKQVTTCIDMARAFVSIADMKLVPFDFSDGEMVGLLHSAATTGTRPHISGALNGQFPFTVRLNKVGIGDLKPQPGQPVRLIRGEASLISHNDTNRRFVVCWQNQPDKMPEVGNRIASIILDFVHATGF